jgi:putative transposase
MSSMVLTSRVASRPSGRDDHRMCLRFVFLLITRIAAWLRLSRREDAWKTGEILILRHQVAVLQRRQPCRPKLNWADRALLATLLGLIPKARRQGLGLLVTPDTIVRWHRDIVRRRQAARSMRGRTGRPATRRNIQALVLRLARENPEWGYRRIYGELADLGINVAASTVWEILKANGFGPAPRRTWPTWSQFLRSQADAILASDFFTAGLPGGTQAYVLAVIDTRPGASASSGSRRTPPESRPPNRPATSSWSSATRLIGSSS